MADLSKVFPALLLGVLFFIHVPVVHLSVNVDQCKKEHKVVHNSSSGLVCCRPVYNCGPDHGIRFCKVDGECDTCVRCASGEVQKKLVDSFDQENGMCFPDGDRSSSCPVDETIIIKGVSPTASCMQPCECNIRQCYYGNDPCRCGYKDPGCGINQTLNHNGVCENCSKGFYTNKAGCGPCYRDEVAWRVLNNIHWPSCADDIPTIHGTRTTTAGARAPVTPVVTTAAFQPPSTSTKSEDLNTTFKQSTNGGQNSTVVPVLIAVIVVCVVLIVIMTVVVCWLCRNRERTRLSLLYRRRGSSGHVSNTDEENATSRAVAAVSPRVQSHQNGTDGPSERLLNHNQDSQPYHELTPNLQNMNGDATFADCAANGDVAIDTQQKTAAYKAGSSSD